MADKLKELTNYNQDVSARQLRADRPCKLRCQSQVSSSTRRCCFVLELDLPVENIIASSQGCVILCVHCRTVNNPAAD